MDIGKYTQALENFLEIMMLHSDIDLDAFRDAFEPLGEVLGIGML